MLAESGVTFPNSDRPLHITFSLHEWTRQEFAADTCEGGEGAGEGLGLLDPAEAGGDDGGYRRNGLSSTVRVTGLRYGGGYVLVE